MATTSPPPKPARGAALRQWAGRDYGKTSLFLGIVGAVMLFIPYAALVSIALNAMAVNYGGRALGWQRRLRGPLEDSPVQSRGLAVAGLVLGFVGVVVWFTEIW